MEAMNSTSCTYALYVLYSCRPASLPTCQPANQPTCQPVNLPTCQPASLPTCQPAILVQDIIASRSDWFKRWLRRCHPNSYLLKSPVEQQQGHWKAQKLGQRESQTVQLSGEQSCLPESDYSVGYARGVGGNKKRCHPFRWRTSMTRVKFSGPSGC